MDERRRLKRQYIMFYSRVFNRQTGEFIGYLGDLTPKGMMVIAESPLAVNEHYELRMDLPEDIYAKPALSFNVRSVWSQPDLDPAFFTIGFRLIDPTPEDIEIVRRIIQDYGLLES